MSKTSLLAVVLAGVLSALPAQGSNQGPVSGIGGHEKGATAPSPGADTGTIGTGRTLGEVPGLTVTTPPPHWIAPGLRLTYYMMSGQNPNGPEAFKLDPKGGWVDQRGNRYTREELFGTGSHGLLQFNIVAMDPQRVAVQTLFYLYEGMNTAEPMQKLETGYVGQAGNGGDLWLHPEALKALLQKHAGQAPPGPGQAGMWVGPVQHTIDQATYNAVQIALIGTSGGHRTWMYDLASGVLLYSSEISKYQATAHQGTSLHPGGSVVKFTTFKGSRTLEIPWARQPAPGWLSQARTFRYSGTFQVNVPGSMPTPFPINTTITVRERGPDWVRFDFGMDNQAPGVTSELTTRVHGNHMLCGSWIPPTAFGSLQGGQVLDTDSFTHATVQVGPVNPQYVTLVQNSPRQQIQYTYRRDNGLLVRTVAIDRFNQLNMSNQIELSFVSMQ